jgi:hypothetical protein
MSTSERADLHRMATKIALSYARCHNETFEAFPALFQTAYHGLLSCSQSAQQEPAGPAKKAVAALRPVAQAKQVVQSKPKAPVRSAAASATAASKTNSSKAAPPKATTQRKAAAGATRGWTTWTGSGNKPGRPPKNAAGAKNGAGRYRWY